MEMTLEDEVALLGDAQRAFTLAERDWTSNRNQLESAAYAEGLCTAVYLMTRDQRWQVRAHTMHTRRATLREKVSLDGEEQPKEEAARATDDAGGV
ncbi:unnamed protein product [marine sediment metagenome]|uniref:Uncharacterized protein n=1 Tax=marine sediment metagenome TaxID=412755 RepID=X1D6L1_9ZZZZ